MYLKSSGNNGGRRKTKYRPSPVMMMPASARNIVEKGNDLVIVISYS